MPSSGKLVTVQGMEVKVKKTFALFCSSSSILLQAHQRPFYLGFLSVVRVGFRLGQAKRLPKYLKVFTEPS